MSLSRGLQQHIGPAYIRLLISEGRFKRRPDSGPGCEMNYTIKLRLAEELFDRALIRDVGFNQLKPAKRTVGRDIRPLHRGIIKVVEVIDHGDCAVNA